MRHGHPEWMKPGKRANAVRLAAPEGKPYECDSGMDAGTR